MSEMRSTSNAVERNSSALTPNTQEGLHSLGSIFHSILQKFPPKDEVKNCLKAIGFSESYFKQSASLFTNMARELSGNISFAQDDSLHLMEESLRWVEFVLAEYKENEALELAKINFQGEKFKNPELNKFLLAYYTDSTESEALEKFDAEWWRLYMLASNSGNQSLVQAILYKVSFSVNKLQDECLLLDEYDDTYERYGSPEENGESFENFFKALDAFFDADTRGRDDLVTIAHILSLVVEYSKERYGEELVTGEDSSLDIDKRIYEHSDGSSVYSTAVSKYIDVRLKPKLETFFQKIKVDSIVEGLHEKDTHYAIGGMFTTGSKENSAFSPSDITKEELRSLPNNEVFYRRMSESCIAGYFADSSFELYQKDENGIYQAVTIDSMLENGGVDSKYITPELVARYRDLTDLKIRANIEKMLGISVSYLDTSAQIALLGFLSTTSEEEIKEFSAFLNKYEKKDRVAICSCCLAFGEYPDFRLTIEKLCHHSGVGLPIVRHINEVIGSAQRIRDFLQNHFRTKYERKNVSHIHAELIKKSYDMFTRYYNEVANLDDIEDQDESAYVHANWFADENQSDKVFHESDEWRSNYGHRYLGDRSQKAFLALRNKVREECNQSVMSQTLFINSFRTLKDNGVDFSLEDIEGCDFSVIEGGSLSDEDISAMCSIYSQNQKDSPAHDTLIADFEKRVQNPNAKFYIYKWKSKIMSFIAFEPVLDENGKAMNYRLKATSFNTSPEVSGYKIGEAMILETLNKESKENIVVGDTFASNPILVKYLSGTAVIHSVKQVRGKAGVNLEWSDSNKNYIAKNKTVEEIVALDSPDVELIYLSSLDDLFINDGKVVTRIFKTQNERGDFVVVIENSKEN